jgi:hypothetical protein
MLKIEVYCSLILLIIFIFSMLSSNSRSDINSTYSLFSYYALLTHRQYRSIKGIIVILIICTILVIGSDIWAFSLLNFEEIGQGKRITGYIWIIIEIILKIVFIVMLALWISYSAKILNPTLA